MDQFRKEKLDTGAWKFELNGISLIVEGFKEKNGKHWMDNAANAIGIFNFKDELYSIANRTETYKTVEDFYQAMREQYAFFNRNDRLRYA